MNFDFHDTQLFGVSFSIQIEDDEYVIELEVDDEVSLLSAIVVNFCALL